MVKSESLIKRINVFEVVSVSFGAMMHSVRVPGHIVSIPWHKHVRSRRI